jgi:hypothetical protein
MKTLNINCRSLLMFLFGAFLLPSLAATADKPRLFVLTDIGGDPDDQMSMVRLMTYANHMEIEGLVATPPGGSSRPVNPQYIRQVVAAYGKVRDNLELHEPGFPSEAYLQERIAASLRLGDMEAVGEGKDSLGSDLLIRAADRDDPRPLWISIWDGPNALGQTGSGGSVAVWQCGSVAVWQCGSVAVRTCDASEPTSAALFGAGVLELSFQLIKLTHLADEPQSFRAGFLDGFVELAPGMTVIWCA